jgi:hypothetical protein
MKQPSPIDKLHLFNIITGTAENISDSDFIKGQSNNVLLCDKTKEGNYLVTFLGISSYFNI